MGRVVDVGGEGRVRGEEGGWTPFLLFYWMVAATAATVGREAATVGT